MYNIIKIVFCVCLSLFLVYIEKKGVAFFLFLLLAMFWRVPNLKTETLNVCGGRGS